MLRNFRLGVLSTNLSIKIIKLEILLVLTHKVWSFGSLGNLVWELTSLLSKTRVSRFGKNCSCPNSLKKTNQYTLICFYEFVIKPSLSCPSLAYLLYPFSFPFHFPFPLSMSLSPLSFIRLDNVRCSFLPCSAYTYENVVYFVVY